MSVDSYWKTQLLVEYSKDCFTCEILDGQVTDESYRVIDEVIYYRDQIFLTRDSKLKENLFNAAYDSPLLDHQGFVKTYWAIRETFSWKSLKEDVLQHIKECAVF